MNRFLELKNLRKSFSGHLVVDIPGLDIRKGEIISILGPSGCGKTTLLRLLAGFEYADEGQILFEGHDIGDLAPHDRKFNTVFQNYALFPHLTVYENIAFGLRMEKVEKSEIEKSVKKMLQMAQLETMAHKYPSQISGGQKQRVAIARALVLQPNILLLDEPLAALDLKLRQRMLLELDLIHDEVGITFIFITHDQSEAMSISDRIAVMNNGRIEQVGTPREIYETPCNNFVASFIGDSNFFEATVSTVETTPEFATLDVEGIGHIICARKSNMGRGSPVCLSLRPEKIHISKTSIATEVKHNVLKGVVDDVIYLGCETKYWVKVGSKRLIVLQQHHHFLSREQTIAWNDPVWLTWEATDGFVLDRYTPQADVVELETHS